MADSISGAGGNIPPVNPNVSTTNAKPAASNDSLPINFGMTSANGADTANTTFGTSFSSTSTAEAPLLGTYTPSILTPSYLNDLLTNYDANPTSVLQNPSTAEGLQGAAADYEFASLHTMTQASSNSPG